MKKVLLGLITFLLVQVAFASTNLTSAVKAVTTAGTRVTLVASNLFTASVIIQAKCANTGFIYVGDSTVTSANGIRLSACDKLSLTFDAVPGKADPLDLLKVYIDASVNGEGVNLLYTSWK